MKLNVNTETVDILKVRPNKWNPNKQTDFIFEKEIQSIKTYGFIDPILVREIKGGFEIIDGEHRWKAASEIGAEKIVINNLGKISDLVAEQLTIIMNETRGQPDEVLMQKLIASLASKITIDEMAQVLPYTKLEMETMLGTSQVDWNEISSELVPANKLESLGEGKSIIKIEVLTKTHDAFFEVLQKINAELFRDNVEKIKSYDMAVQTLVEMAIKHGFSGLSKQKVVKKTILRKAKKVVSSKKSH